MKEDGSKPKSELTQEEAAALELVQESLLSIDQKLFETIKKNSPDLAKKLEPAYNEYL